MRKMLCVVLAWSRSQRAVRAAGAQRDVERQQMLFGRVVLARMRRQAPIVDEIVGAALVERGVEPVGEIVDPRRRRIVDVLAAKFRKIVGQAAAADDQHAVLPQRRQRLAEPQMVGGTEPRLDRQLRTGMSAFGYISSSGTQAP